MFVTTWILVITISGWNWDSGRTIDHIEGFENVKECLDNGVSYVEHSKKTLQRNNYSVICIPQTKKIEKKQ